VGVTRVIEPANKSTETSNTDPATKKNPAPLVSKLTVESPKEYRVPKRKAKVNPDQITVLPSTVPVLKVRDTSSSIRASVPNNKSAPEKPAKPEKTPSPPPKNQLKSAPKEVLVSNSAKQTPEQEWFQLLKQEGALARLQLKRVQELLEKTPRLAISVEGKGRKVRTALFYALSTGKAEAVGLIMRANSKVKQDMAGTLRQVFDEILIVGDSEVGALKACLSMLSESELAVLRDALNQQYKPGEMRKKLAMPLLDVLRDMGAIPAEPEGIDDSRNQSFVRDKKIIRDNWVEPLPRAVMAGDTKSAESLLRKNSGDELPSNSDLAGSFASLNAAKSKLADLVSANVSLNAAKSKLADLVSANVSLNASISKLQDAITLSNNQKLDAEQATMAQNFGWNAVMRTQNALAEVKKSSVNRDSWAELAKVVLEDGWNALMLAAQNNQAAVVKSLIDHASGAEQAKMVKKDGWNALMLAAQNGHTEVVKLLMNHASGAEQAKMVDKTGWNALMIAAKSGSTEVVKLLMNHDSGAEQIKMVSKGGWNALMIAASNGQTEVVKLLMAHDSGAEQATMINEHSLNALMLASGNGQTEVVKLLMNHDSGAEQVKMVKKDGWNALMLAAQKNQAADVK
jgi:ankyrin repeat protein